MHYAEACNELAGLISASLRPGNRVLFKDMLQRWRAVGNTVSGLTSPRFEPQTSRFKNEPITARPTGGYSTNDSYSFTILVTHKTRSVYSYKKTPHIRQLGFSVYIFSKLSGPSTLPFAKEIDFSKRKNIQQMNHSMSYTTLFAVIYCSLSTNHSSLILGNLQ